MARNYSLFLSVILFSCILTPGVVRAQQNIFTERYDNSRTGAYLNETRLNASNVNVNTFGKVWTWSVDGSIYAQPLYLPNVAVPGKGSHNVVYVVTMNDKVYAFDADTGANSNPLWMDDFTNPSAGITPIPIADITGADLGNITGNVGIESTPVIDPNTNTMYLVARTKENGNYVQTLHALDVTSGAEKFGGPAVIHGSVPGSGNASSGGTLTFDPKIHNQRSSLALANGMIIIAWSAHEDLGAYHGWIMAYNAQTLHQTGIFCSTPDGGQGGIWQAGRAPVVDASSNIFYMTGNGDWDGIRNFGESFLKLNTTSGFALTDWFTVYNWEYLNSVDRDLGSSGPILIPGTDLLFGGGKQSMFYLMHTANMGHEQTGDGQIVQVLNNNSPPGTSGFFGGPVFWNRTTGSGPTMYIWANDDFLKAYHFNGTNFDSTPILQNIFQAVSGSSGGVLTLSANGNTPGTGILWSSMPLSQNGDHGAVAGVLRAFDADDLSHELWNSVQSQSRDDMGLWPKFSPPTVMNGKVYMGSFSNQLSVYGFLSNSPDFTISTLPASKISGQGGTATFKITVGSLNGFPNNIDLAVSGLPAGANAAFSPLTITGGSGSSMPQLRRAQTPRRPPTTLLLPGRVEPLRIRVR